MGAMQNGSRTKGEKAGKRGTVKNSSRLDTFARGGKAGEGDWGGCDCARLQAVIVGITAMGGAVTFGLSRDKGAHSLTLMLDGDRQTLWLNGSADLDEELDQVVGTLNSM